MSDWSDPRILTLRTLWLDGLSAAEIAKQLGGVTRNAVLGKVHRLGLSGRGAPMHKPATLRPRRPRPEPRPKPAPRPRSPRILASAGPPLPPCGPGLIRDMRLLGAHCCKWPIGDPKAADFSFCGQPCDGRYCEAHEAAGVRRGTARPIDGDPVVRRALKGRI